MVHGNRTSNSNSLVYPGLTGYTVFLFFTVIFCTDTVFKTVNSKQYMSWLRRWPVQSKQYTLN